MMLKGIINKLLETQHENISEHLVKAQSGFQELDLNEEDIPEVNIGYGFYHEDKKYCLRISLEKDFD